MDNDLFASLPPKILDDHLKEFVEEVNKNATYIPEKNAVYNSFKNNMEEAKNLPPKNFGRVERELEDLQVKLAQYKETVRSYSAELNAKNKVLEWYAEEEHYGFGFEIVEDSGHRARKVLIQWTEG